MSASNRPIGPAQASSSTAPTAGLQVRLKGKAKRKQSATPGAKKQATLARAAATKAYKQAMAVEALDAKQAELVIAKIESTLEGATNAYTKSATKRISDLRRKANIVSRNANEQAADRKAAFTITPAERMARAGIVADTPEPANTK